MRLRTVWQRFIVLLLVSFHCSIPLLLTPLTISLSFSTTVWQFSNRSRFEILISMPFCTKLTVNWRKEVRFCPTLARIFSSSKSPVKNIVTPSLETLQVIFNCPSRSASASIIISLETRTVALKVMKRGRRQWAVMARVFWMSAPLSSERRWRGTVKSSCLSWLRIATTLCRLSFSDISSLTMVSFSSMQSSRSSADCEHSSTALFLRPFVDFLTEFTRASEVVQMLLSVSRVLWRWFWAKAEAWGQKGRQVVSCWSSWVMTCMMMQEMFIVLIAGESICMTIIKYDVILRQKNYSIMTSHHRLTATAAKGKTDQGRQGELVKRGDDNATWNDSLVEISKNNIQETVDRYKLLTGDLALMLEDNADALFALEIFRHLQLLVVLLVQGKNATLHGDLAGSYFLTPHRVVPLACPPLLSGFIEDQLASGRQIGHGCIGRMVGECLFVGGVSEREGGVRMEEGGKVVLLDGLFIEVDLLVKPVTAVLALGLHAPSLFLLQEGLLELLVLGRDELGTHLLSKAVAGCMLGSFETTILSVDILLVALVADGAEGAFGGIGIDARQPIFHIAGLRNLLHLFDVLIAIMEIQLSRTFHHHPKMKKYIWVVLVELKV